MNKKLIYVLIAIILLIILCLAEFMKICIKNGGFNFGSSNTLLREEKYDLTEMKDLTFDVSSSDIEFFETDSNELRVVQYGNKNNDKFEDKVGNSSIKIVDSTKVRIVFFNFNSSSRYEVYLPTNYSGNLNIKTVSGKISLADFNLSLKDLLVKTTSGDINLKSILKTNDAEIKSVSGEIYIKELTCNDAILKTTSGDIEIDKMTSKDISINSVSGELVLGYIEGIMNFKTTSGEISIDDLKILDNSNISTVSGEVKIDMNKDNNCVIGIDTLSGDSNIRTNKYGNRKYDLNIKTTSGDIRVD